MMDDQHDDRDATGRPLMPRDRVASLLDEIIAAPDDGPLLADDGRPKLTLAAWLEFRKRYAPDVIELPPMPTPPDRITPIIERLERLTTTATGVPLWSVQDDEARSGFTAEEIRIASERIDAKLRGAHDEQVGRLLGVQPDAAPAYTARSQTYVDVEYTVVDRERPALGPGTQPAEDGTERDV